MSMDLIETVTVGAGGASSILFTAIPGDATDLLFKINVRSTTTGTSVEPCLVTFNSNTTGYSHRTVNGNGSTVTSTSGTSRLAFNAPRAGTTANTFGNVQVYVPNYAGAVNKVFTSDSVTENNAVEAHQTLIAGLWANTAAITSASFAPSANNFAADSTISLYKITKGSGGATVS